MICPCKDCENKGCGAYHSSCEPYLAFVKERNELNEWKHEQVKNHSLSEEQEKKHWRNLRMGRTVSRR